MAALSSAKVITSQYKKFVKFQKKYNKKFPLANNQHPNRNLGASYWRIDSIQTLFILPQFQT